MKTVHFVEFAYPGLLFSETSAQPIGKRDAGAIEPPQGCYAFRFFSRKEHEDVLSGVKLTGEPGDYSGWYFLPGSRKMSLEDVKREMPEKDILIRNMVGNGYKHVVKTVRGNVFPLEEEDVIMEEQS